MGICTWKISVNIAALVCMALEYFVIGGYEVLILFLLLLAKSVYYVQVLILSDN